MGTRRRSQLQPEAARRLNPVSGLTGGAALGVLGADDTPPHRPPNPGPPHSLPPPAGYWLPAAKWNLHVLQMPVYIRAPSGYMAKDIACGLGGGRVGGAPGQSSGEKELAGVSTKDRKPISWP